MSPRISIIIPTFNRAWSLPRTIASVLNQTSKDWELIIVDDGSTDDTAGVIKEYLTDTRVRYFKKENGGVGTARNFGIAKASNELVTFLDSDDEFVPNTIELMQEDAPRLLTDKSISMVLYLAKKNSAKSYQDNRLTDKELIDYKSAVQGRWPRVETVQLCRKETFNKYLFPTLAGGHETILWNSILKYEGPALLRTKIVRIYHTEHDSRLTGVSSVISRARTMPKLYDIFLKEFEEDYKALNPKQLAYFYLEKGIFEIVDGDVKAGRNSIWKVIQFDKGKLPVVILVLCASILPQVLFGKFAQYRQALKVILSNLRGGGL